MATTITTTAATNKNENMTTTEIGSPSKSSIPLNETTRHVNFSNDSINKSKESNLEGDIKIEIIPATPQNLLRQDEILLEPKMEETTTVKKLDVPDIVSQKTISVENVDVKTGNVEIKDTPPKHGGVLQKTRREQIRHQAEDIQKKLRNQAGMIRTKFSNIRRPSLNKENNVAQDEEKSKFRLPEMHVPKINFPDRKKFKLPERPKFHMPETAKFHLPDKSKFRIPESSRIHLPDKSKFHLPERPKFNLSEKIHLPERPKFNLSEKIHLPERPKFNLTEKIHLPERPKLNLSEKIHLPERPKFNLSEKIHLPERGKFHLPDKSKFRLPEKSKFHFEKPKFHLPEKAKFHLPEKGKFHLPKRPNLPQIEIPKFKRTRSLNSPSVSSGSKFDFKTYPKLFRKNSAEYTTSSPKQTRGRTPPPRMKDVEVPVASTSSEGWIKKLDDLKYADDDMEKEDVREIDSRKSESINDYEERELNDETMDYDRESQRQIEYLDDDDQSEKITKSDLFNGRKKGVLEEINSDEYFLRQKGISQDDIDMGKYLSHEIREAFKSPGMNALAKMDYMDDENVNPEQYQLPPMRPTRSGSTKKKSILKKVYKSDPSLSEEGYKTYPPRRPGRKSRSQSKSLLNEEAVVSELSTKYDDDNVKKTSCDYDNEDVNMSRYDNVDYEGEEEKDVSDYYKTPGPVKEYEYYKVPRSHKIVTDSPSATEKSSLENCSLNEKFSDVWYNANNLIDNPPVPMARKKKNKQKFNRASEKFKMADEEQAPQQVNQKKKIFFLYNPFVCFLT